MRKRCYMKKIAINILLILFVILLISSYLGKNLVHDKKWKQNTNRSFGLVLQSVNNNSISLPIDKNQCETLHLAIVCAGSSATIHLVTLIKSVLFYRKNPIHVHFLVDKNSKVVLSYLFQTWDIPDFAISFYTVNKYLEKISWIQNNHYSGVYGLLKVVILDILPKQLNKVIVLDTDLVFNADITELWNLFKTFDRAEAIGLVENQSNWYLGTLQINYSPWPALGRGFNTGVMLLDCKKLRKWNWSHKWQGITKNISLALHSTALADQDIINSILKEYPFLVHVLPCKWNIQLSDNMKMNLCSAWLTHDFGIFHRNNKKKQPIHYGSLKYPQLVYQMFANMNGDAVKFPAINCKSSLENDMIDLNEEKDLCKMISKSGFLLRRVHLYFLPFSYNADGKNDVSIVVQLNFERLLMFEKLCLLWKGPISVALYATDAELLKIEQFITESENLHLRTNIAYHVVYKNSEGTVYPINLLRNVALKNAVTEFVFLYDVDFMPMPNLYEYIVSYISSTRSFDKTVYIIPAFETKLFDLEMPQTKSDLLREVSKETVLLFKSRVWPKGHAATNYSQWKQATSPYPVKWCPDFEPYVVVKRKNCPIYDKRFSGFGWNKVSHIMELDASGSNFFVLPFGFIIHYPHVSSADLLNYRKLPTYRDCLRKLKASFINYLQMKYGKRYN